MGACAWYWLAIAVGGEETWIAKAGMLDDELDYKYLTALHWSLTQFTPAGMDISARNALERIFSIVVLFFAMIAFSSIVANITSSMTNQRNMKGDQMKQLWLLRRYLKQRKVPSDLSERIARFLDHRAKNQGSQVNQSQLVIIKQLSNSLRNELFYCTRSSVLINHCFFRTLDCEMRVVMHKICIALGTNMVAEKEVIFHCGETAKLTYFTRDGKLKYSPITGESIWAHQSECISEAALWVDWRHQGELRALADSELFELDPVFFLKTMQTHPTPWFYAVSYARNFEDFVREMDPCADFIRDDGFQERAMNTITHIRTSKFNAESTQLPV